MNEFQNGDKVKFVLPRTKKVVLAIVCYDGEQRIKPGGPKVPGYWVDRGKRDGTFSWVPSDCLQAAKCDA